MRPCVRVGSCPYPCFVVSTISLHPEHVADNLSFVLSQSRDRLLRTLRGINAGDAADQVIRQVDKMMKNYERASRDARFAEVIFLVVHLIVLLLPFMTLVSGHSCI